MRAKDLGLDITDEEQIDEEHPLQKELERRAALKGRIDRMKLDAMARGIEKGARDEAKKKVKQMADKKLKRLLDR
ncbi:MAG: hypothetical protein HWE12_01020 [Oceanospirillaceae bacterium]|nr:hypothetical protein [Oceanospirillaceae bacterium]